MKFRDIWGTKTLEEQCGLGCPLHPEANMPTLPYCSQGRPALAIHWPFTGQHVAPSLSQFLPGTGLHAFQKTHPPLQLPLVLLLYL